MGGLWRRRRREIWTDDPPQHRSCRSEMRDMRWGRAFIIDGRVSGDIIQPVHLFERLAGSTGLRGSVLIDAKWAFKWNIQSTLHGSALSLSRCLVGSSGNGAKQFNQTDPFPNGVRAATASMMWRMVPDLSAAHVLSYPFSASSDVCPMRPIPQMDPPFPSSYSARWRRFFSPAPIGYRVETFLRPHAAIPTRPT